MRRRRLRNLTVWVLTAALIFTMGMPAAAFASEAPPAQPALADQVNAEVPAGPAAAEVPEAQPALADLINTADPAGSAAQEEPADPEPPAPVYVNVYRVEKDADGVLWCYWYDETGMKQEEPVKDASFIVTFDEGSLTEGSAVKKVGNSGILWHFDAEGKGKLYTGWFTQKDSKYYFKKGKRYTGTKKIKKTWYKFSKKNGRLLRKIGDDIDKKFQNYSSATRYLIVVKLSEFRVRIYNGGKGRWDRIHKFKCTIGKPSTPTVRGTFTIGGRGRYFNTGKDLRCWYYTQFHGNYLFHSVLYDRSPAPVHVRDGRLGKRLSHGCIRMKLANAKWIYSNIPRGTKVIIY